MKAALRLSGQDSLRLVYALAQGSLLALLWTIIDPWMSDPPNPGLGLSGLLLPATALALILTRKRTQSPALLSALALAMVLAGVTLLLQSFFHAGHEPVDGQYKAGHYIRLTLALLCAAVAWLRGWRLPGSVVTPQRAIAGMQWGLAGAAALLFAAAQGSDPPVLNVWAMILFLLFSFASFWLAQKQAPADQTSAAPMGAGGAAFICGLGAVGLTSLLLWGLAGAAFRSGMEGPAKLASRTLGWGLAKIEGGVIWFFGLFSTGRKLKFNVADVIDTVEHFPNRAAQPIADSGTFAALLLMLILCVAAVIVLVWLFRKLARWAMGIKEQDAGLYHGGRRGSLQISLWTLLKIFMTRLRAWLGAGGGLIKKLFSKSQPQDADYYFRRLLIWARQRGLPRQANQTPYEVRDQLAKAAPDLADQLHVITHAFVQVRYGPAYAPEGPGAQAAPQVVESWQQIKTSKTLRRQKAGLGSALARFAKVMTR